jgi:hypothetical protein
MARKRTDLKDTEITLRQVDNEPLHKLGIRIEDFNVKISDENIQVGAFKLLDHEKEVKIKEHVHKIESFPVWVCYDREAEEIYFSGVGKGVALAMIHVVGDVVMGWRF